MMSQTSISDVSGAHRPAPQRHGWFHEVMKHRAIYLMILPGLL